MANVDLDGNVLGVTDIRHTQGNIAADFLANNYLSVALLRARLQNISGAYYTTAFLNTMTKNDMVYAIRLNDEAAGI